ncbi:MAG: alpha-glucan family phosphorylase, partial [Acidobacteria bacterium]|nr:alpha-glucan family phosphorylase [Acidobacteriota bacterium]
MSEWHPDLPDLPPRISQLNDLASDLWWVWHFQARDIFRTLDYQLWRATAHNPVRMLRLLSRERLQQVAEDPEFLALYDAVIEGLHAARTARQSWWTERFGETNHRIIAYFSAEFAVHQSLPIYAGGLGVLAGDTCKEANDLGLPFVGVGFMYPQGYFHQHLSSDGWQLETYEKLDWADAPINPAIRPDGSPCVVAVPLGDRTVLASVWQVRAGRVRLYLLDTDLEENAPWDRALSARLYGGNQETRIQQEIVLGLGGVRALEAMGITPAVWHLNEGHAAFVVLQRIRRLIEQGSSFDEAVDEVRRSTVFTTHTPVPAGHDAFPFHLVETHLAGAWGTLGPYRERFMALGLHDSGGGPLFNMTALALRTAGAVNAVSRLHADVTTRMWEPILREIPAAQPPLRAITNGVHVSTWVAPDLAKLFEKHLGADWRERYEDEAFW